MSDATTATTKPAPVDEPATAAADAAAAPAADDNNTPASDEPATGDKRTAEQLDDLEKPQETKK